MKNENGVTLISLTIYIIALAVVVAVIAVLSGFFFKNTKGIGENIDLIGEYTRFNTFFSDEVNHENIRVLACETQKDGSNNVQKSYIVFSNGVQYTFVKGNKGIYRNKVKISRDVENCEFTYKIEEGKQVVQVDFAVKDWTKQTTFILKI